MLLAASTSKTYRQELLQLYEECSNLVTFYSSFAEEPNYFELFGHMSAEDFAAKVRRGGWLAKRVPVFCITEELPACDWLLVKDSLPQDLRARYELLYDTIRACKQYLERLNYRSVEHCLESVSLKTREAIEAAEEIVELLYGFSHLVIETMVS